MAEPEVPPSVAPPSWRERIDLLVGGRPPAPRVLAAAVVVVVVAVMVVLVVLRERPGPAPELTLPVAGDPVAPAETTTTAAPAAVVVHAAGAVAAPGVYRLDADARVADLVDAAGGPAAGADVDQLNLAAPLVDGQRIYLPLEGEAVPEPVGGEGGPAEAQAGPVDLNTATAAELDELPGVGPATSAAILEERDRRGRFTTVDDLLDVPGIGETKLERLRGLVRV